MKQDMDNTRDHRERLVVLERDVYELAKGLGNFRQEVKQSLTDLSSEVRSLFAEQAKAPKAHSYREIAMTVGVTISIMTASLTGLAQFYKLLGAVDAYRLEQLEKKANPNIQYVKPIQ